jgi:hypothetical protein
MHMFFYHRHRPTLVALDEYLVARQNRATGTPRIGGVELLSLRLPLPEPGAAFERYRRRPLDEYPRELRKVWYVTPPRRDRPAARRSRLERAWS